MRDGCWNYRLMRRTCRGITQDNWYEIVEAYYTKGDVVRTWTERAQGPKGETVEEAKSDYELMAEAFTQPILDETELLSRDISG